MFNLQDRVLQAILFLAVHPIVEYQADPHSFGFRPNRSAVNAVGLLIERLEQQNKIIDKNQLFSRKILTKNYDSVEKCCFLKRRVLKDIDMKKCRQEYFYDHYGHKSSIFVKNQKIKNHPFLFFLSYHIIDLNLKIDFDNNFHQMIFEKYPICNKYRFLFKS